MENLRSDPENCSTDKNSNEGSNMCAITNIIQKWLLRNLVIILMKLEKRLISGFKSWSATWSENQEVLLPLNYTVLRWGLEPDLQHSILFSARPWLKIAQLKLANVTKGTKTQLLTFRCVQLCQRNAMLFRLLWATPKPRYQHLWHEFWQNSPPGSRGLRATIKLRRSSLRNSDIWESQH
jgi:hypothetical protein